MADGGTTLNSTANPTQTLQALYSLPASDFHDITSGYNGLSAGPGYDEVTGRGSPIANLLIPDLIGYVRASLSQSVVSVQPTSTPAGGTAAVTLTVKDANGNPEAGGGLTVAFGLGAGSAGGTFSSVTDNGNGTYTATFTAAAVGSDAITASIGGQPLTSSPATLVVTADVTTTGVSSSLNPAAFGNSVTLTATVANTSSATTPAGSVGALRGRPVGREA